ncbi:MAG TPA: hypothetical protein VLT32_12810 [Candidatus Sulfomarinibacteraceae bacterium]|nr:hypothetical protein [Candidatus Sulfomarinibacteraceae bacterium]
MDRPDPELEYYRRVEDLFACLRGMPHILSPRDFQLLRQWWRDGVPMAAVVTGLTEVFAKARERGDDDPVASLSYCRHAVRRQARRLAAMHAGAGDGDRSTSPPPDQEGLRSLVAALEAVAAGQRDAHPAVAEAVRRTGRQVATALEEVPPELLDEHLFALESELLEACWAALPARDRDAIDGRTSEEAAATAGTDEARRRSRRALRDRELRRLLALPRLEVGS